MVAGANSCNGHCLPMVAGANTSAPLGAAVLQRPGPNAIFNSGNVYLGSKVSDTEFIQYLSPVGFGPSSNT